MTDHDDDDVPWADPKIQADFVSTLGRFILAFNEVDYLLSQAIAGELARRGNKKLADRVSTGGFSDRLDTFEVLYSDRDSLKCLKNFQISADQLRSLGGDHNILAHGYFDQNPFDGDYKLIMKRKNHDYPTSKVDKLIGELEEYSYKLRCLEGRHDFDAVKINDNSQ